MPQHLHEPSPDQGGMAGKGPPEEGAQARSQHPAPPLPISNFLRFLSALPTTRNKVEWITIFHRVLARLLEDAVDHVGVQINIDCPLAPQEVSTPAPSLHKAQRTRRFSERVEERESPLVATEGFESILKRGPAIFEYHFHGRYLGTILLLRDREEEPVSPVTSSLMKELEPFMIFIFTDLIARHSSARPIRKVFREVVEAIALERRLTEREQHVLKHHLLGRKYAEIKDALFISIDTVKKHVKRIHRKTGARSATELFARYFSPLIDGDDDETLDE